MTIYEVSIYEVSIPNPNDAPAALASLVASGLNAEMLEVPGSAAWIKATVDGRDGEKFSAWFDSVARPIGGDLFEAGRTDPLKAEVIFHRDACVGAGITALRESGCDVALLPQRDPWSTAIWLRISVAEKCDGSFFDWVQGIVEPLGGDVLEADLPRRQPSPTAA